MYIFTINDVYSIHAHPSLSDAQLGAFLCVIIWLY